MKKWLAVIGLLTLAVAAAWAQSNTVTVTLPDGRIIAIAVPETWATVIAKAGGWLALAMCVARFLLRWMPSAVPGTAQGAITAALKHISLPIPDQHSAPAPDPKQNFTANVNVGIGNTDNSKGN